MVTGGGCERAQLKGLRMNENLPAFFHVFLLLFFSGSRQRRTKVFPAIVNVAFISGLHNIHVYTENHKFQRKKRNVSG